MVDDFGYKAALPPVFSFGIGLLSYAAFVSVYGLVSRLVGFEKNAMVAAYLSHRIIWPRTKLARKKLFAALLVNPFTEELFYRGFLVFYLGNLTGSMGVFLLIGLAACLAIHSYQDIRLLFFHGAVYAVTIGLLVSPVGLLGCFGFHLAGDLYPLTILEKQRDVWKRFERGKRASRAG
jgi:hypothetical protein